MSLCLMMELNILCKIVITFKYLFIGQRNDISAAFDLAKAGSAETQIAEEHPDVYVKYSTGIKRAIFLFQPKRDFKTEVYWFHGSTGGGKSRFAHENNPGAYWKSPITKWWDGYSGDECVIIDDYRRDFCTFADLLRLFDRYPLQVETKGGTVQFYSRKIIITTPRDPVSTWVGRSDEDLGQLLRRIEHIQLFGDVVPPLETAPFVSTFQRP